MAFSPFRMPKDVPRHIARALYRTSSRTIPKPGQMLSYDNAFLLHDLLTVHRQTLRPVVEHAVERMEAARTVVTRQKWQAVAQATIREAHASEAGLREIEAAAGVEPLPPLASRDVVPVVDRDVDDDDEDSDDYALREEGAEEIEIGADYRAAKGRTSDVSFNARLFRKDGRPITESDARSAMYTFTDTGRMPSDIGCRSVTWSGWKGTRTRTGRLSDLENFRAILMTVGDYGLRVGLVKPDRL